MASVDGPEEQHRAEPDRVGAGPAADAPDPSAGGFAAPAEWSPHRRCWMAWPNVGSEWPDYEGAQRAFRDVFRAVAEHEALAVLCRPEQEAEARRSLPGDAELHLQPLDDAWMRDIGPTFLVGPAGARLGVDWRFNAWGGKWEWRQDDAVAARVCELAGVERVRADLVFEGGAVHFDGDGTLLTTRQCALAATRNPGRSEPDVERALCRLLGGRRVLWLDDGLVDDHTDGHIDEVACFAAPGRVLLASPAGGDDPNTPILAAARRALEDAVDAAGRRLEVVDLPLPPPVRHEDVWLPRSYVNFYLADGAVVAPSFGQPTADDRAFGVLREQFPGRRLVAVEATALVLGGGGIHCITQQEPAAG